MHLPTIMQGLPEADYRAHPAYANSDLKIVRTLSPAHMQWRRAHPDKDTPAKRDGRILHCAILEPTEFSKKYVVLPPEAPDRPTDAMREAVKKGTANDSSIRRVSWWDAWNAENETREIITADKYEEYMRVTEAIRLHPMLRGYFEHPGESELSVFATDPVTGLPVKIRKDRRVRLAGMNVTLDLKSTECAQPDAFDASCERYGYWQGAAFYTDVSEWAGDPTDLYLLIGFEREGPYGVIVAEVDPDAMNDGRAQYRAPLTTVAHCIETGIWPNYQQPGDMPHVARRPAWARGRV